MRLTNPVIRLSQKVVTLSLAFGVLCQPLYMPVTLAASDVISGDIRVSVTPADIRKSLPLNGGNKTVNLALHGVSLSDAFRALAKKGGFNVIIDESVEGSISVDLHDVKIQDALETLKTYGKLAYSVQDGNTLLVAAGDSERGRSFSKSSSRVIPLRYASAKTLAKLLNDSLFPQQSSASGGAAGAGGGANSAPQKVTADYNSNSLIVVGTPTDIRTVLEHVEVLDAPRDMKTWRLSHANAVDVAAMLAASLFNEGNPVLQIGEDEGGGGGGSGGGSGDDQAKLTKVRTSIETISEGTGASSTGGASSGGTGGSASTLSSGLSLRTKIKASTDAKISPEGAIIIPDSRLNAITLMGTAEQIAMAENLIQTFDRKVPQVVLEVSLIELSEQMSKAYNLNMGGRTGRLAFGHQNTQGLIFPITGDLPTNGLTNNIGLPTTGSESLWQFTTSPIVSTKDFTVQLNNLLNEQKAKQLANPTIVATHNSEAVISFVDEVIRSEEITISPNGTQSVEAEIGEAGIILNILPQIGADGSTNLRIRPTISTVSDNNPNDTITLLAKREILAQNVNLRDGETFVLGGLIQETNTDAVTKNPILSDLPILGALARSSSRAKNRTELIIVITPHVMNDENAVARLQKAAPMTPVNLPTYDNTRSLLTPVAQSSVDIPGAIPPLQGVSVLDNYRYGEGVAPQKPHYVETVPANSPSGFLMLQDEQESPKAEPPAKSSATPKSTDEISADAIQALLERLK